MLPENIIPYLRDRFRLTDAILFTGAGFSRAMLNSIGQPMPLADDLKPILWRICFPGDSFDPDSSLQDLFDFAKANRLTALKEALNVQLTISTNSIPGYYGQVMALPWHRAYTLNVDNFHEACGRAFALPRRLRAISALQRTDRILPGDSSTSLDYVQLNGTLKDGPEKMTFSTTQYGDRFSGQDPLYAHCAVDILSRPVVFIGTPLGETPLWHHIIQRRRGAAEGTEFRRKSFLITPQLDRARRELLEREFNVYHVPMTLEQFAVEVLSQVESAAEEGRRRLQIPVTEEGSAFIPTVTKISVSTHDTPTEFLLGQHPTWSDVRSGRAARRQVDDEVHDLVKSILVENEHTRGCILLTGTAGSGKSTALMRLAMRVAANGIEPNLSDSPRS